MPFIVAAIVVAVDHADSVIELQSVTKSEPAPRKKQERPAHVYPGPYPRRDHNCLSGSQAHSHR